MTETFTFDEKELMARLQAPIADDLLCWRPGPTSSFDGANWKAIYYPYIPKEHLENRLDVVLGLSGWTLEYREDAKGITHCMLSITLPSGQVVVRHGIGSHSAGKGEDEEINEAKGARTQAFRDACSRLGVCGRDILGTQTVWIPITVSKLGSNGKPQYFSPGEDLNRSKLVHAGSNAPRPSDRGIVEFSPESKVINPAAHEKITNKDLKPDQIDEIIWPIGKHKGKPLSTLSEDFLLWAQGNLDILKPGNAKCDQFLYEAVQAYFKSKSNLQDIIEPEADEEVPF